MGGPVDPTPWRVLAGDGLTTTSALFAVGFGLAALTQLTSDPEPTWVVGSVLVAVGLSVLAVLAYRRARTRVVALLERGPRVTAVVVTNRAAGTGRRLLLRYEHGGRQYTRNVFYIPGDRKWVGVRKAALGATRAPAPRDDSAWLRGLKAGERLEVVLDPANPHRLLLPRLYARQPLTARQRLAFTLGIAALVIYTGVRAFRSG